MENSDHSNPFRGAKKETKKTEEKKTENTQSFSSSGNTATDLQVCKFDKEFADDLNNIKKNIESINTAINSLNGAKQTNNSTPNLQGFSDLVARLKEAVTKLENIKLNQSDKSTGSINCGFNETKFYLEIGGIKKELETTNKKLEEIKIDNNGEAQETDSLDKNEFELKTEHKTYFTWTAVFAIALVLSAIFIAHRYPFDFANPICLVSIIAFCVSFVATCGYNLYFAFRGIDLSNSEGKRLRYFVICGIFVGITLGLSIAVLAI